MSLGKFVKCITFHVPDIQVPGLDTTFHAIGCTQPQQKTRVLFGVSGCCTDMAATLANLISGQELPRRSLKPTELPLWTNIPQAISHKDARAMIIGGTMHTGNELTVDYALSVIGPVGGQQCIIDLIEDPSKLDKLSIKIGGYTLPHAKGILLATCAKIEATIDKNLAQQWQLEQS